MTQRMKRATSSGWSPPEKTDTKGNPMAGTPSSSSLASQATTFSLDITLVEDTDAFAESINLTDDNCGTTCPNACCTSSN